MTERRNFDKDRRLYMSYEVGWIQQACPYCDMLATWHAVLFKDEPREPDDRITVGDVFGHDGPEDCAGLREDALIATAGSPLTTA